MQNAPDAMSAVRAVSRARGEVLPQAAAFAALQGFAEAVGVPALTGVPAERQPAIPASLVERRRSGYDAFYEAAGAFRGADGLYHGPMLCEARPLQDVKAGHKIRTRRRRALKASMRQAAAASLADLATS